MMRYQDVEAITEALQRVVEFRQWVDSNVLFPVVPDALVKPMRDGVWQTECALVAALYGLNELERVAMVRRVLT